MLPTQLMVSTGGEHLATASWEAVEGQKYSLWVSAPVATTVRVVFNAPTVLEAEAAAAQLDAWIFRSVWIPPAAAAAAAQLDATPDGGERVPDGRLFRASAIVTRADDTVRLHLTVLCGSRGVHELQEPQEQELSVTVSVEPHEPQEQEQESDDSHGDEAILFMLLDTGA
jgi:hypothetical protein